MTATTPIFDLLLGETFGQVSAKRKAAQGYVEGQARDFHGRFGEGGDAGRSILQTVREQGGMTVSPLDASSPTTGYVVARPDVKGEIVKADDFFDPAKGPAAIVAFMDANPTAFDGPGEYLGLWHDTAHGEVALDAVEVIEDQAEAEAAGRDRDEQAIWDVAGGAEIPTGGTGHRAAATTRLRGSHGRPSDPPRQAAEAVGRDVGRREVGVGDPGTGGDGGEGISRSDARLIERLSALRQQLGTRLLAAAQQAYEAALRQAGVKLVSRARNRTSPTRQRQAIAAVDGREALAPWLAAVGLTEEDMLAHAFDTFNELTIEEVRRYRERQAELVSRLGSEVALPDSPPPELVADYLVAGLTAMVRARLRIGDRAMVAATISRLPPLKPKRAPRFEPDELDLPAGLPDPDELASAAARLVRNALFSADGRVHPQLPATPDRLPTVVVTGDEMPPTIEEKLALEFRVAPVWRWEHGYYGEPLRPFDAHEQLDGLETTERDSDPNLYNGEAWPPTDLFAPGDHEGCTCEFVIAVDEA